ncbi:MAG: Uncharacterised protein [Methanobacteriota archaeon]|nr:hypothetical protein [Euryarchaeota archaeon]RAH11060.1 MAG: hypothetical protein CMA23_002800 [Euryarchaeota archaeon]CAI8202133.1 MAG: Uncharacterised protein [Euryarchaeota archaeon]|tara:strand:- start:569 stop:1000 length:432 start_codon:yes stop_codon:yes gene_type:complete
MMRRDISDDEAQMLLATGVVLILALLSMAIYSVKVVGMGEPYDAYDDAVLQTAEETKDVWQTSIQYRFDDLNGTGTAEERCLDAANSVKADLMRHGEHRGVEIILVDLNATINSDICTVVAEAGIADRNGRLLIDLHAEIDLS